jgi:positive regulator of sigma E activity
MSSTVHGLITKTKDDQIFIDVPRQSGCQGCGKKEGCSMTVLAGLGPSQSLRLAVSNQSLKVGETVDLKCSHKGLVKAAFWAYGPGSVGLVVGASVAALNGYGDGGQALGALLGLGLGLFVTRLAVRRGGLPTLEILKGVK